MDTKQLTFELNMALNPYFAALTLRGQSTTDCLPRYETVTTDETEDCDYVDVNVYWKRLAGVEPDPFMTVEYNTGDKCYSYALLKLEPTICHRGEISDPGGWEPGEYHGPFKNISTLGQDLKKVIDENERQAKAESEIEAAENIASLWSTRAKELQGSTTPAVRQAAQEDAEFAHFVANQISHLDF